MRSRIINLSDLAALGAPPKGMLSLPVLNRAALDLRYYEPGSVDRQQPHTRDELYIVVSGSAEYCDADGRHRVTQSAAVFVAAGVEHRFESMSKDFAVWVVFYGPEGGEPAPG